MTLLAAFKVLLHRYSGQEDIVVGSPIASRNRSEVEGVIGLFANALVLRTELSGAMTFRALLAGVRETCLSAYEHQDLPFEKLVTELKPERNLSYTPIFQVMFILQNMPKEVRQLAGLTLSALDASADTTKFDLTLSLTEGPDGIRAVLAYNTDLFGATTIERMLGHYQRLLEGIVVEADRALDRLPLLGDDELRQILGDWSGPRAERPRGRRLHDLIEEHASRAPDAAAVVGGGVRLSYGELDAHANQLAHHLARRGVGPGTMVGICMERCPGAIVAIVAVLKAGGAYVAIDPAYPPDRRAFMIADSHTPVILVNAGSRDQCAGRRGGDRPRRRLARDRPREPRAPRRGGGRPRSGLRRLHLGLDRPAQGGRDPSFQSAECLPRVGEGVRPAPPGMRPPPDGRHVVRRLHGRRRPRPRLGGEAGALPDGGLPRSRGAAGPDGPRAGHARGIRPRRDPRAHAVPGEDRPVTRLHAPRCRRLRHVVRRRVQGTAQALRPHDPCGQFLRGDRGDHRQHHVRERGRQPAR